MEPAIYGVGLLAVLFFIFSFATKKKRPVAAKRARVVGVAATGRQAGSGGNGLAYLVGFNVLGSVLAAGTVVMAVTVDDPGTRFFLWFVGILVTCVIARVMLDASGQEPDTVGNYIAINLGAICFTGWFCATLWFGGTWVQMMKGMLDG